MTIKQTKTEYVTLIRIGVGKKNKELLNLHNTKPGPGMWILVAEEYKREYKKELSALGLELGEPVELMNDAAWYEIKRRQTDG